MAVKSVALDTMADEEMIFERLIQYSVFCDERAPIKPTSIKFDGSILHVLKMIGPMV